MTAHQRKFRGVMGILKTRAPEVLFDDSYKGPRWTYGMTHRPAGWGAIPRGAIIFTEKPHAKFAFGTVAYPRRLTDDEVRAFELTRLGEDESDPVDESEFDRNDRLQCEAEDAAYASHEANRDL